MGARRLVTTFIRKYSLEHRSIRRITPKRFALLSIARH